MEKGLYSPENATAFEFVSRSVEEKTGTLLFTYAVHFAQGDALSFRESIELPDPAWHTKLPEAFKKNILEDLHLILGISYFKLFCPPKFMHDIALTRAQAAFWNTIYTKGLGEFRYRNGIDLIKGAAFAHTADTQRIGSSLAVSKDSLLVGIGGGKDSIVALELLGKYDRTGFVVETGHQNAIAREVASIAKVPLASITRTLDPQLIAGVPGAYNGHVPISAVYAFLGVLRAAVDGHAYVVVSNEHSSNFGNLMHEGSEVNHQWSKSTEFESLFKAYVFDNLTPDISYFSLLRPFYELRIVKQFTKIGQRYFHTFSSCNRNFAHAHEEHAPRWCGECPKCVFGFLMLSAFLPKEDVVGIFKKDLFEDRALLPLFKDILGFGEMKPFDCVGTFDESRMALTMASEQYGDSYMVRELMPLLHEVPLSPEIFRAQQALTIPTRFRMLGMESALILGYGREGKVSEAFLKGTYPHLEIGIADQEDGEGYLTKQDDYDIIIKTPVIPAKEVWRQYTSATQLFFARIPKEKIIGITGSKGKSTTSTLLFLMLKELGLNVRLIGNIGTPALQECIGKNPADVDFFVYELSSYQLEDLDVSPHISIVTSLFPEHIDHHDTLEAYYEAKHSITRFQDVKDIFIYANGFPLLEEWADATRAQKIAEAAVPFAIANKALRGAHMKSNVALAYTVAKQLGVNDTQAQKVIDSFEGLPHRLQLIGTYKGIEFYDDSISTTPESAIAGLRAIGNVDTIILGGVDRGYQFDALEKELRTQGVRNVILFPESGEHMLKSEEGFTVLHTSLMEEAVRFAYETTKEGRACLLSPAAPSYNLFKNFEERGDVFKSMVEKYGKV